MTLSFRVQCTFRVLMLSVSIGAVLLLVLHTSFYFTTSFLGIIVVFQVLGLIRFVEKTNRDVARFLDAIEFDDFTQSFANVQGGRSFRTLRTAFTAVMEKFQKARAEKEAQFLYLRRVVQHVDVGLVAFERDGTITLINDAMLRLLSMGTTARSDSSAPKHVRMLPEQLSEKLLALHVDERTLLQFSHRGTTLHLLLHATQFMLRERMYTLVSLHNIQSELDKHELESWQKLARVLTHEIMNSITPIASLASTTGALFASYRGEPDVAGSITSALHTIENRSGGLLRFVESYRKLLRVPAPVVQPVCACELLERVENLVRPQAEEQGIALSMQCEPKDVLLVVDAALMEQALINLVLNAMIAVAGCGQPRIDVAVRKSRDGQIHMSVRDNGIGMNAEVQEKIFVPFFTTRKDGSGVGLSIAKQIVYAHSGSLAVQSAPGEGTTFTIRL